MFRTSHKLRGLLALVLLGIPYLLLFIAGTVWLYQYHTLLWWAGISVALSAAGFLLLRSLPSSMEPPRVLPDASWPPQGAGAWPKVEELARQIEAENPPLAQPEAIVAAVRRVLDAVARHYHPQAKEPWLETPLPDVLRIVELVARDLRKATLAYVPGAHIFTVGDMQRVQRLAGFARDSYLWYRAASFIVNTPAAFLREVRDGLWGRVQEISSGTAKRWAIGYFVRRAGFYAIQLYGRQLPLDDAMERAGPLRQSRRDADDEKQRAAAIEREPLRIMLAGQTKAGKSSLVNAIFGEHRAATDVVPRTSQIEPYVFSRDGLEEAIVLDSAGYDTASYEAASGNANEASAGRVLRPWIDAARGCDIVICVCSAATAARESDSRFLAELRAEFQRTPDRRMPVVIVALTNIDRLRPIQEWSPPYRLDPPEGHKAQQIVDAVEAVAGDLFVPLNEVIPVCTLAERVYNVDDALIPAILAALPEAERVKYVRCLRQRRDEEYWQRLWRQTVGAGRVVTKWMTAR